MKQAERAKLDAVFGNVVPDIGRISQWRELPTPPSEPTSWDRSPLIRKHKGKSGTFECFPIRALAEALGRRTVTIRSWEDKGIIPPDSPLRDPPPSRAKLPSKVSKGQRLYKREHIEAAVAAAKVSGVYDPSNRNANWAEFSRLVWTAWGAL